MFDRLKKLLRATAVWLLRIVYGKKNVPVWEEEFLLLPGIFFFIWLIVIMGILYLRKFLWLFAVVPVVPVALLLWHLAVFKRKK